MVLKQLTFFLDNDSYPENQFLKKKFETHYVERKKERLRGLFEGIEFTELTFPMEQRQCLHTTDKIKSVICTILP